MADNVKLITNLFGAMQQALFLGDPLKKGEFVSFMAPGQFVDTKTLEDPGSDSMAVQSEITNVLIDTSFVNNRENVDSGTSKELAGSVDQVYHDVLYHAALPHRDLSGSQPEIDRLTAWIQGSKKKYDRYKGLYNDAAIAYETERSSQHPNPVKLRILADAQKSAYSDWQTIGQKNLYETKKARIVYLTAESPETLWAQFQQDMEFHKQQAPNKGTYYSTFLSPSISNWETYPWASFEQTITEEDHYQYSHETSWSGGASGGWGLWSFGGGTSGSNHYQHTSDEASGATLRFEYQRVRIDRPWLAADVLAYRFWTWRKEFGFDFLSHGGNLSIDPPLRPIGRMPVLPQYLIVVRNVEITANFSKKIIDDYASQVSHNVSMGWGPFSVSGNYSEGSQSHYVHADLNNLTFKIAHPQIIARTGILLPTSPDPILSLPWQDDAVFPPKPQPATLRDKREFDYLLNTAYERYLESAISIEHEYRKALKKAQEDAYGSLPK